MTTSPTQDSRLGLTDSARKWAWPTPWINSPRSSTSESGAEGIGRAWAPLGQRRPADQPDSFGEPVTGPSAPLRLLVERGQSLWLDHLTRDCIVTGRASRWVSAGIRGIIANPASLARALETSAEYDDQLSWLFSTGCTVEEAYRELAATDALAACALLRTTFERSQHVDGFVSIEVAPTPTRSALGTFAAVRRLHQRIDRPNLLVAIPATPLGVPAIQATVSAGRSIHATSIFSISRYSAAIDAYQSGLETFVAHGGDPRTVHGVASFSLSLVDAEVDRRLDRLDARAAIELRDLAAVAQAKLAYRLFEEQFSTERWARLARLGARPQRLMWESPEKDLDNRYLDELNTPNTIYALPESAVAALNTKSLDVWAPCVDTRHAAVALSELAAAGIDLDEIGGALESHRAARAQDSLTGVFDGLSARWGR